MGENYPLNLYVGARFLTCILKVNKVRSVFQVFLLVLGTAGKRALSEGRENVHQQIVLIRKDNASVLAGAV
jgi:hypothetical protein